MNKLDACLPLIMRDHERFQLLDQSLRSNFHDINRCWVIVPDREYPEMRGLLKAPYEVIPESELIPELRRYRFIRRVMYGRLRRMFWPATRLGRFNLAGWYVQQLLKLAIAERIETEFYLTLDADVLCIKPTQYDDLIKEGRALVTTEPYDAHPDWYVDAQRILGCQRSGVNYGVTPSILNRNGVLALCRHIESRFIGNWRTALIRNTPWTEYTLYHTFLEGEGLWDRYHINGGSDAVYDTYSSLWSKSDNWNITDALAGNARFIVIQSTTGIPVEDILERIETFYKEK